MSHSATISKEMSHHVACFYSKVYNTEWLISSFFRKNNLYARESNE